MARTKASPKLKLSGSYERRGIQLSKYDVIGIATHIERDDTGLIVEFQDMREAHYLVAPLVQAGNADASTKHVSNKGDLTRAVWTTGPDLDVITPFAVLSLNFTGVRRFESTWESVEVAYLDEEDVLQHSDLSNRRLATLLSAPPGTHDRDSRLKQLQHSPEPMDEPPVEAQPIDAVPIVTFTDLLNEKGIIGKAQVLDKGGLEYWVFYLVLLHPEAPRPRRQGRGTPSGKRVDDDTSDNQPDDIPSSSTRSSTSSRLLGILPGDADMHIPIERGSFLWKDEGDLEPTDTLAFHIDALFGTPSKIVEAQHQDVNVCLLGDERILDRADRYIRALGVHLQSKYGERFDPTIWTEM